MIDRRLFLAGLGTVSLSVPAWGARPGDLLLRDIGDLARSFRSPPDSARPWVIWFWINGNVTRDGITADLEAMKRVGIGGVQIMDVDPDVPAGPVQFGTGVWNAMLDFALAEAERLGLVVELNDDDGWTGSAGPWITPELSMQKVVWSESKITGGQQVTLPLPQPESKLDWYRDITVLAFPTPADDTLRTPHIAFKAGYETNVLDHMPERGMPPLPTVPDPVPADGVIEAARIVDLSHAFADGRLTWQAPPGNWTVMRIGHTTTGADNHPVSKGGQGLECDKLSKRAIRVHMEAFVGQVVRRHGAKAGATLLSTHIDSWEVGAQNWTADFAAEFHKRRGYDPLPWLPALSGRTIGDAAMTERFLWDMRKTISDLLVENYAAEARRIANAYGLRLSIEGYDADPTEQILYGAQADVPQTEFWYSRDFFPGIYRSWDWTAAMTSAAHVYGKRIVAAEAFTGMPDERWQGHPATMKALGDWAFTAGVNQFVIHRYAMQPWSDRKPGLTMGAWGMHYERSQTWWELSGPWHQYLTRAQHMLRQGQPVADLLYLVPEGAPGRFVAPHIDIKDPTPPDTPGYNNDGCTADALFTRVSIVDGLIALPDGKRYRALVLPTPGGPMEGAGAMTPGTLTRLAELVEQGMTMVGPPPHVSPSLSQYPQCDADVRALADRLWGSSDAQAAVDRRVGKGRVVNGPSAQEVLAASGLPLDFSSGAARPFRYVHRRLDDGSDLYFVANKHDRAVSAPCTFRAKGAAVELWHPETGRISAVTPDAGRGDVTAVTLRLEAHEAVFVIISNRQTVPVAVPVPRPASIPAPVGARGPWTVHFTPGWGAPEQVVLPNLVSWPDHGDKGVKYFSGTATYIGDIEVPASFLAAGLSPVLDLGDVGVIARVRLNGKDLGILWKAPFFVATGSALRAGRNRLEIDVTNLWPNRMIGDEQLPPDAQWAPADFGGISGFGDKLVAWPEWLLAGQKSPQGRFTFASWKLWGAKDRLLPSGLLGPVALRAFPPTADGAAGTEHGAYHPF